MPLTLDEIVVETQHWPPERVSELVDRLTEDLHASDPEIEAAWKAEVDRRIAGIESGNVKDVSAEEVSARLQKILKR
jgi:putative addiction module component (TIGR02574 family)